MPTIPPSPPPAFTAGETLKWSQLFADYSAAAGWSCTYLFDGPAQFTIAASADGAAFAVTVAYGTTAAYTPGEYAWTARVEKSGERYIAAVGTLRVLPNPASGTVSALYTAWQTALQAFRDLTANKMQSGTINGKTFTARNLAEMRAAVDRLEADYRREKRAVDRLAGRGGKNTIKVRFGLPT